MICRCIKIYMYCYNILVMFWPELVTMSCRKSTGNHGVVCCNARFSEEKRWLFLIHMDQKLTKMMKDGCETDAFP